MNTLATISIRDTSRKGPGGYQFRKKQLSMSYKKDSVYTRLAAISSNADTLIVTRILDFLLTTTQGVYR